METAIAHIIMASVALGSESGAIAAVANHPIFISVSVAPQFAIESRDADVCIISNADNSLRVLAIKEDGLPVPFCSERERVVPSDMGDGVIMIVSQ